MGSDKKGERLKKQHGASHARGVDCVGGSFITSKAASRSSPEGEGLFIPPLNEENQGQNSVFRRQLREGRLHTLNWDNM